MYGGSSSAITMQAAAPAQIAGASARRSSAAASSGANVVATSARSAAVTGSDGCPRASKASGKWSAAAIAPQTIARPPSSAPRAARTIAQTASAVAGTSVR